jgi:hypothetical protein
VVQRLVPGGLFGGGRRTAFALRALQGEDDQEVEVAVQVSKALPGSLDLLVFHWQPTGGPLVSTRWDWLA